MTHPSVTRIPSAPVLYRLAQRQDIARLAWIWHKEKSEGGASEARMMGYFDGLRHPQHALLPRVLYVAQEPEQASLVGYIAGHLTRRYACDGELQWLYVTPEHRNCGVASELLVLLASWLRDQRASRVCVDVDPANTIARAFYTRHGAENLNRHWLIWTDITALLRERRYGSV